MKFHSPYLRSLAGFSVASVIRNWMSTLDFKTAYYDRSVDPAMSVQDDTAIFLVWHEYIPFPFYLRGNCKTAMLLSRHRDAEWLAEAARYAGHGVVRGSTTRGGSTALREIARRRREINLSITPDGPRGPRREFAQGPIYLSSTLQIPLVAMGCGYDRPWRMPTWDRFAVPRPYSRARAVVSERIMIPPNLDRDGIEHYRRRIARLLLRLTDEAEAWAESGTGKLNQVPTRRQAAMRRPKNCAA